MRFKVLQHFHCSSEEYSLIFTSGATASLKLVAECFGPAPTTGGQFLYLQSSHTSLLGMREIMRSRGFAVVPFAAEDVLLPMEQAKEANTPNQPTTGGSNDVVAAANLLAYSGMDNFSGYKYPIEWIQQGREGRLVRQQLHHNNSAPWFVLLDASSLATCEDVNLAQLSPDFVTLSFYKLFGYPTGLGALLVHKRAQSFLHKTYFGGGTIDVVIPDGTFHKSRSSFHQRFEDGTLPFLDIVSLEFGFNTLRTFWPDMHSLSEHLFQLAQTLASKLKQLKYLNGAPVVKVYAGSDFTSARQQGGIVCFNVLNADGGYIGYNEIQRRAELCNIQLRTGCFCNIGSCQRYLNLTNDDLIHNWRQGHVCGDSHAIIDNRPTGAVRVSFGYMSSQHDVDRLIQMFHQFFVLLDSPALSRMTANSLEDRVRNIPTPSALSSSSSSLAASKAAAPLFASKIASKQEVSVNDLQRMSTEQLEALYSIPRKDFETLLLESQGRENQIVCLCLYPVKACGVQMAYEWPLSRTGLLYDRSWVIVRENGNPLGQKVEPKLCHIRSFVDLQRNYLILSSNLSSRENFVLDLEAVRRDESLRARQKTLKVCDSKTTAFDCGDDVADWICEALGRHGCRLLWQDGERQAVEYQDQLSLAATEQFLFINLKTAHWLSRQVPEEEELDVTEICYRMRPNIIANLTTELLEDDLKEIGIGETLRLKVVEHCERCHVICYDQRTGRRPSNEPLRTLTRLKPKKVAFGVLTAMKNAYNANMKLFCPSPLTVQGN